MVEVEAEAARPSVNTTRYTYVIRHGERADKVKDDPEGSAAWANHPDPKLTDRGRT